MHVSTDRRGISRDTHMLPLGSTYLQLQCRACSALNLSTEWLM